MVSTQLWWQKGRRDKENFPDKIDTVIFLKTDWKKLISHIDKNKFFALPSKIGCADCDDGGSEWIEIKLKNKSHKITFEYGKNIKGIEMLISELRQRSKITLDSIEKRNKVK